MRTALGTLVAGLLVAKTAAQTDPGPGAASISGTWSSGAKNVLTGPVSHSWILFIDIILIYADFIGLL
jgi:hypothetical protein